MTNPNEYPARGMTAVSDTALPRQPQSNAGSDRQMTLRESVEQALQKYFAHLDGQQASDVYNLVLSEVEAPLLETVMRYVQGNQTRASEVLGLNRGTLRKKLKQYDLL